ncbi:AC4 [Tomato leaf curl New Delhi virus 4]|uniref:AC4 n=1 Tax=Tomato leaf curl New Delhi virus 4 TaxID=2049944 RepID=V5N3Q4_9GEMI|nr:AC4 [Tomato leaf curl New Delhi virus 4]AHA82277.1 AC4 [Tomato leaf curl New Delhi virus 4]
MGFGISRLSSNSKGNSTARITDAWNWFPQVGQHISIRTFRELRAQAMSNPTWKKTETF